MHGAEPTRPRAPPINSRSCYRHALHYCISFALSATDNPNGRRFGLCARRKRAARNTVFRGQSPDEKEPNPGQSLGEPLCGSRGHPLPLRSLTRGDFGQNKTNPLPIWINHTRNAANLMRNETNLMRNAADLMRNAADLVRNATNLVRNAAIHMRNAPLCP